MTKVKIYRPVRPVNARAIKPIVREKSATRMMVLLDPNLAT